MPAPLCRDERTFGRAVRASRPQQEGPSALSRAILFIPRGRREPLGHLLRGQSANRPPFWGLSPGSVRKGLQPSPESSSLSPREGRRETW
eukprot:10420869-Alexandrium_andersonii.AAC.1